MSTPIQVQRHVRSVIDPDGAVILDLRRGKYYSLNGVGAEIWLQIEAGRSAAEIEGHLVRQLGAPAADARRDTADFLADLRQKELIDVGA